MDIRVGDRLLMKKKHPCGAETFTVLRVGMDFRLAAGNHNLSAAARRKKALKK